MCDLFIHQVRLHVTVFGMTFNIDNDVTDNPEWGSQTIALAQNVMRVVVFAIVWTYRYTFRQDEI